MERTREGMAILLDDVSNSAVIDFGCVSYRTLWIKFTFSKVKVCVVVGYGPSKGAGEGRKRFWNEFDMIVDRIGNGYRLCVLGDLNGWIGDRVRVDITGAFRVPEEKDNGRRVVKFCAERGLRVGNTYVDHK